MQDLDGQPIPGATTETWQANSQGYHENQQPDQQPEFNLRGIFSTDAAGSFRYKTVRPAGYTVPCDGPVGQLLGGLGFSVRRPALLHFLIKADGFETISTLKSGQCEIVTGVMIPPDFTTFWKQAQQQGFKPKVASIGKAILFP